jgi:energy-coupling factor transporter ATP-binding protein EcfA2
MRLRGLELEQFRKFEQPVRLSGFSDTLNLLCGPNEFGKSTILAAIRGLMFERYSSKAEPVRRMQPWRGNAAPRLAMDFEVDGSCWRIEKRFLHQPWARLKSPDGHSFEGDAAEEELQRLLGFGAAGKKGATAEQLGVWGALWVEQRKSVDQADLSSDLARATIASCLDAEVGVLTGSEKGQAIVRAAQEQRARLLDGNGKPKGRYKEVIAAIAEIDKRLLLLRDRQKNLADDSGSLRQALIQLAKIDDPAKVLEEQQGLDDARRRRDAAQSFQKTFSAAEAVHKLAVRECEAAESEQSGRRMRYHSLEIKQKELSDAAAGVRDAQDSSKEASDVLARRRCMVAAAEERAGHADQTVRKHRRVLALVQLAGSLSPLEDAIKQAGDTQREIASLLAKSGVIRVDKDGFEAILTADRDYEKANSALQAQATVIEAALEDGAEGKVALDGTALPPGRQTISIVNQTEFAITGIGRITIRPVIKDHTRLAEKLSNARATLDHLLAASGCRDAAEAENAWRHRQELDAAIRDARTKLALLAPGDKASNLKPGVEALREYVEVLRLRIEAERRALDVMALPTLGVAETALHGADEEDVKARENLNQTRAEVDAASAAANHASEALMRAEAGARTVQADVDRLQHELDEAVSRESDLALAARLAGAEAQRANAAAALAKLDAQRTADTVETMDARIQRYEQAQKNRAESLRRLREHIAELRARITQEGGVGLDEIVAADERERALLIQERDAGAHDAEVLTLLLETLGMAERESKERYLAPVIRRVTPYLRGLFPGADIACDDSLRITGLSRDADGLQAFERLSDGTQEQIAVLARLAFAEMLIDQGKPAMLILDDALAYSDDDRIERMFDILSRASQRTQILVLTCREDLFARLGGNRLEVVTAAPILA